MKIFIPDSTTNYRLIDSGNGHKLEQYGSNTIIRPDTNCVWQRHNSADIWTKAQARYQKMEGKKEPWIKSKDFREPWLFTYQLPVKKDLGTTKIVCELRTSSKSIGIFPEQEANWSWMTQLIQEIPSTPLVLNLFGYTGAATLAAAAAGADVCHVDASQAAVNWARHNQSLSKLGNASIRWIVEDAAKFIAREIKRGVAYDGLILDPPAFGRDNKGRTFEFEKEIVKLLGLCKQVLKPKPLFVIFNGYSMGYSATVLHNLLNDFFPKQDIEFGELHVQEYKRDRTLPCSLVARFTSL